ncbi:hypothetical protein Tco_1539317 [Tanacetum coccineum]
MVRHKGHNSSTIDVEADIKTNKLAVLGGSGFLGSAYIVCDSGQDVLWWLCFGAREVAKLCSSRAAMLRSLSCGPAAPQIRPIDQKQEVPQEGPMCDLLWYGNVAAILELDAYLKQQFRVFEAAPQYVVVGRDEAFNFGTPKPVTEIVILDSDEGTPGLSNMRPSKYDLPTVIVEFLGDFDDGEGLNYFCQTDNGSSPESLSGSPDTTVDGSTIGDHELLSGMSSTVTEIQNEQHMNAPGQNSVTSVKSVTKALKYLVQLSFIDRYNNGQCYEDSHVVSIGKSPRMDILLKEEKNVLDASGCVRNRLWNVPLLYSGFRMGGTKTANAEKRSKSNHWNNADALGWVLKFGQMDRKLKDGGEVKEFQRSFRHSDTERLSRTDEVLKSKNFKKDATIKLFKSTNQERYEHVGPEVTSSQDGKVTRWRNEIMLG